MHIPALWILRDLFSPVNSQHCTGFIQSMVFILATVPNMLQSRGMFSAPHAWSLPLPSEVLLLHYLWYYTYQIECSMQGILAVVQQTTFRAICACMWHRISVLILYDARNGLQRLYLFRLQATWKQSHACLMSCWHNAFVLLRVQVLRSDSLTVNCKQMEFYIQIPKQIQLFVHDCHCDGLADFISMLLVKSSQ